MFCRPSSCPIKAAHKCLYRSAKCDWKLTREKIKPVTTYVRKRNIAETGQPVHAKETEHGGRECLQRKKTFSNFWFVPAADFRRSAGGGKQIITNSWCFRHRANVGPYGPITDSVFPNIGPTYSNFDMIILNFLSLSDSPKYSLKISENKKEKGAVPSVTTGQEEKPRSTI